jgi:hypothetical protein
MRNMKKFMLSMFILAVLMFSSCGFIEGIIPPSKEPFGRSRGNIAYIFENNKQNGVEFRYFLEESNYFTEIININAVVATDLSGYELIIIDSDSGYGLNWGTQQIVDVLIGSNGPFIGLGEGGARFFQNVGISINLGNSDTYKEDFSIYVVAPTHPVFTGPEIIEIPANINIVQLCSDLHTFTTGIRESSINPSAIRFGYSEKKATHYPLIQEGRFILWGYNNTPLSMTNNGKKLFFNIVNHLIENY